jgi:hypothetical protein
MKLDMVFPIGEKMRRLWWLSIFLLAASVAVSFWGLLGNGDDYWFLTRIFDFDVKNNLPHAYKSLLLLAAAGVIFWIVRERNIAGGNFLGRWRALGWIFLFLAVDEEIQIHQQFVAPLVARIMGVDVDTAPNAKVYWIAPYLGFALIFAAAYLPFLKHLPKEICRGFVVAGVVYVSGAAVVEEIAHLYAKHYSDTSVPYLLMTNFSEWLQMAGSILFVRALLQFQAANAPESALKLTD